MTSVWPALCPPWKRTTTSACSESQSTILPLPSSPHCEPTTTTFAIQVPSPRPATVPKPTPSTAWAPRPWTPRPWTPRPWTQCRIKDDTTPDKATLRPARIPQDRLSRYFKALRQLHVDSSWAGVRMGHDGAAGAARACNRALANVTPTRQVQGRMIKARGHKGGAMKSCGTLLIAVSAAIMAVILALAGSTGPLGAQTAQSTEPI